MAASSFDLSSPALFTFAPSQLGLHIDNSDVLHLPSTPDSSRLPRFQFCIASNLFHVREA